MLLSVPRGYSTVIKRVLSQGVAAASSWESLGPFYQRSIVPQAWKSLAAPCSGRAGISDALAYGYSAPIAPLVLSILMRRL